MTDELAQAILAELKKLNGAVQSLLCLQKVADVRKSVYPPMGPTAGSVVDGKASVPDASIPNHGTNGVSGGASV